MPLCRECGDEFPNWVVIGGTRRNLKNRKFCLKCSPFGEHNTSRYGGVRKCRKCGEVDASKFHCGRKTLCAKCENVQSIERHRDHKRRIVDFLGGECVICGYSRCLGALHLHHHKGKKDINFPHVAKWKWARIVKELKKCMLVCGNCHAEIHEGMVVGK